VLPLNEKNGHFSEIAYEEESCGGFWESSAYR
jgi:hypothetical protein